MKRIVVVAGTRPEIIKLAPVVHALSSDAHCDLVLTGQHDEMAAQALSAFDIEPLKAMRLMEVNQTPELFLSTALAALTEYLPSLSADLIVVQGDTATTFAAALSAFHLKIPFAHVEAGLRTGNLSSPFPEEGYRSMISRIATTHFCPTPTAVANLAAEGINENVHCVGNTVVDALRHIQQQLVDGRLAPSPGTQEMLTALGTRQLVLVTGHRRENHHAPLQVLCQSIQSVALAHPDTFFLFPVHPNPNVRDTVHTKLRGIDNVRLCDPLDYVSTIAVLQRACLVVSDSGGIQEEAPYCGTYVLVTREHTERPELLSHGGGELFALRNPLELSQRLTSLLSQCAQEVERKTIEPFGDGQAALRIREHLTTMRNTA